MKNYELKIEDNVCWTSSAGVAKKSDKRTPISSSLDGLAQPAAQPKPQP
jgi:hypothetical protein